MRNDLEVIIKCVNALKPFADIEVSPPRNIAPSEVWLWKPSGTRDLPGINYQHILDAKKVFEMLEGGKL